MARGFKVADAYVELTIDKDELRRGAAAIPGEVGPQLDRAGTDMGRRLGKSLGDESTRQGEDAGGKLALGMRMSIIRNSPLIVAAVAGALAVGAPVALAGATALFAGIGIVAAAQSEKVQSAWLGAWQSISRGAQEEARPIEGVLVNLASRVESRFEALRPVLGNIFQAAAPQIDVFADGMLGLVENVLPGFQRAIERGMPVTQGFASFLEKTGTGLAGFLDGMSEHSAAAGQVFDMLGDTMAVLLPLLGNLIGTGAELATGVLPLLNGSLQVLNAALEVLGPILPTIVAGFAGMKVIGALTGVIDNVAGGIERVGMKAGMATDGVTRFRGALSAAGLALPVLGVALGVAFDSFRENEQILAQNTATFARWAQGINQGGAAASQAFREMAETEHAFAVMFGEDGAKAVMTSDQFTEARKRGEEVEARRRASLTESARASEDLAKAEYELERALDSADPSDDAPAWAVYESAQRTAAEASDRNAQAIKGVTEAMVAAADQARAAVDATFAYERSLNGVEDAQATLAEAQAHLNDADEKTRTSMEDVQRAALGLNEAYGAQVAAAKAAAESELPAALDEQQKAMIGNKAALDELNALIAFGVQLPPSMEEYRQKLIQQTSAADGATLATAAMSAAVAEAGYAVSSLPDGKGISITGIEPDKIAPMRDGLRDLGFEVVTLPDGKSVEVRALTEEAKGSVGQIDALLTALGIKVAEPQVTLNPQPVIDGASVAGGAVDALGQKSANPMANLHNDPLVMAALESQGLLDNLNGQTPTPAAYLADDPLVQAALTDLGILGNLNGQTPTPVASLNDSPFQGTVANDFGQLLNLASQHAIPMSSLNDGSLVGTYLNDMGLLGGLAGQRPTPVTSLNDGPFQGTVNSVMARIGEVARQRPNPTVSVFDAASGVLSGIKRWLDSIQSKTVTVTTLQQGRSTTGGAFAASGGQVGKIIRGFAGGGVPSRRESNGRLRGPGGPLDDLIPAITSMGEAIRVANEEWIINGAVSRRQGQAKMAALNSGQADIVPRRFDGGGPIDERRRSALSDQRPLAIYISGTFDLASSRDLRRAATVIHSELKHIERSLS